MTNIIRLKTFIGYQINSAYHKADNFKRLGERLNAFLSQELSIGDTTINLEIEYGEFPPGANIWEQVRYRIESSHIAIFDISENNPNVLLEAGIAIGTNKHVIFLKCQEAECPVPSDLNSLIYIPYSTRKNLASKKIVHDIVVSIKYFLNDGDNAFLYYHLFWSLDPISKTIIVPSMLPEDTTSNIFEDYMHMRIYGDLDALALVQETIHRLYPRMDVSISHARNVRDLPKNWDQCNLILIGGPDFNPLVNDFEDLCPIGYRWGALDDNQVWLYHKKTNCEYRPEFAQQRAQDHGFFLKINQLNTKRTVVFIGGARTWGVYGAAKLVSCTGFDLNAESYRNAKLLVNKFGSNPSILIRVVVVGSKDGVRPPTWTWDDVEVCTAQASSSSS